MLRRRSTRLETPRAARADLDAAKNAAQEAHKSFTEARHLEEEGSDTMKQVRADLDAAEKKVRDAQAALDAAMAATQAAQQARTAAVIKLIIDALSLLGS